MIEIEEKAVPVIVDIAGGEITANIEPAQNMCVAVGQVAQMDTVAAVNYIKSGEAEINAAVLTQTAAFNANAAAKTTIFDDNAVNETTAFNSNAALKQAEVDAKADAAAASATLAQEWAVKTNGTVDGSEYSAKYYAEQISSALVGYATINYVDTGISSKQDTLVSGTNLKTVNNQSLLGSGDISVTSAVVWGNVSGTLSDQTDLQNALNAKQDTIADLTDIRNGATLGVSSVQLSGAQTVTGVKTFTDIIYNTIVSGDTRSAAIRIKNNNYTLGTTPSAGKGSQIQFLDSAGDWAALFEHYYRDTGKTEAMMAVRKQDKSTSTSINVGFDASGNKYTSAPACDAVDSIVTTLNKTKSGNGYYELGNGLILQWGNVSQNTNTTGTITFPKPFVNGYKCVAVGNSSSTFVWLTGDTNTAITWNKTSATSQIKWIAIGC